MFESKNVLNSFSPIEGHNIAREFSSLDSSLAHSLQTDVSDFRSTTLLFDRDRALSKEEWRNGRDDDQEGTAID